VVAWLLEVDADADAATSAGKTALLHASQNVHLEVVKELLRAVTDMDKATTNESMPLDTAVSQGHATVAARLRRFY
jgi:ankyrin repeat protein